MEPTIRPAVVSDAAAIVSLGREIDRDQLATVESFRALLGRPAESTIERLVAEADGRIVAWAPSGAYASGDGWLWIGVERSARRCGLGSRLYERIEARLRGVGVGRVEAAPNDEDGRRFLIAHGFGVDQVIRNLELDPRTVTPVSPPSGVRVVPLAQALDEAEALFHLFSEARADVPTATATPRPPWTSEEWRAETIDSPLIDLDASVVVFEGDEPVALAWLYSDREGGRAEALMAATRRDRRGRGLATLAKVESSRRAAALGITRILTSNNPENAPMLAVNRKLGYTETAVVESYAKRM
jgi:GNAT superfamily N-acetyltransferase